MAMTVKTLPSLAGMLAVTLLLSGCALTAGGGPDEIATYDASSGGMSAAAVGVLVLDKGCLYIEAPDGGHRYLPVFPDEVSWNGERLEHDSRSYALGDEITFSGGQVDVDGATPEDLHIPEACVVDDVLWLVSPH